MNFNNFKKIGIYSLVAIVGVSGLLAFAKLEAKRDESDKKIVKELLAEKEFSNISVGMSSAACISGLLIRREFNAKNKDGEEVDGIICGEELFAPKEYSITTKVKNKR